MSQNATALFGFYLVSAIKEEKVKLTENQIVTLKIMPEKIGQMKKNDYLYTIINKKPHK